MSIVDPHVSSFCTIASRRRAWIWHLHGVFDHGEGSSWRTRLGKGSKFEKSHHRIIKMDHRQSYTLCFPQKGVHFIRIENILQQKPSLIWVTFLWQDECEMLKEERLVVKRVDGEEQKWSSRISSINTVWETDQTDMTDVLCQSEIFCSLRHLRLDLGGHPDFLSASFFLRGMLLISLMCCASVLGVRVNCQGDSFKKVNSEFPCLAKPLESTAGRVKVEQRQYELIVVWGSSATGTVNRPECCMMMRSRWCQWQGSWVSGVEVGLKSSFTSVWDLELTAENAFTLYIYSGF